MNAILSLLIREAASAVISRELIDRFVARLVRRIVFYAFIIVFGITAFVFLYVLLDRWLTSVFDGEIAAALLCGGNLLIIGLLLIGRTLSRTRKHPPRRRNALTSVLADNANLEAGIALGIGLGKNIRKIAPEIAVAAALAGLVIGMKPKIMGFFRKKSQ